MLRGCLATLRGDLERRLVRENLPAVLVEPPLRVAVTGPAPLDELPELRPVVMLHEMADLVHDDVVEHVVRCEDESPVEAERALARARAPSAPLVTHRDPLVGDAERRSFRLGEQDDACPCLAPALFLGEAQPLETEAWLRGFLELLLEPLEVRGDRGVDLRVRRARGKDKLW